MNNHPRESKTVPNEKPSLDHKKLSDSLLYQFSINVPKYRKNPYQLIKDIREELNSGDEGNHIIGLINPNQKSTIIKCCLLYNNIPFFVDALGQKEIDNISEEIATDIQKSDVSFYSSYDEIRNIISYFGDSEIVEVIKDKIFENPIILSMSKAKLEAAGATTT